MFPSSLRRMGFAPGVPEGGAMPKLRSAYPHRLIYRISEPQFSKLESIKSHYGKDTSEVGRELIIQATPWTFPGWAEALRQISARPVPQTWLDQRTHLMRTIFYLRQELNTLSQTLALGGHLDPALLDTRLQACDRAVASHARHLHRQLTHVFP